MASNSQEIIQDVRIQFEQLLDFVTGDEAKDATADQIERGLFKLLVQFGYKLLQLFFIMRSETSSREPLTIVDKQVLARFRCEKKHLYKLETGSH